MKIIAVTNRSLSAREFFEQLEVICHHKPVRIILREKDLVPKEYSEWFDEAKKICSEYNIPLSANTIRLPECEDIQLSYTDFIHGGRGKYKNVGVSVHSVEEAVSAEERGADYLIAGHIFATDCKKGIPPRGVEFLSEVCAAVKIPVYAIGGMDESMEGIVKSAGAAGICMMSGAMRWN